MKSGNVIDVYTTLWDAVHSINPNDVRGWFQHSGYVPFPDILVDS
jgi:hypothetical protein